MMPKKLGPTPSRTSKEYSLRQVGKGCELAPTFSRTSTEYSLRPVGKECSIDSFLLDLETSTEELTGHYASSLGDLPILFKVPPLSGDHVRELQSPSPDEHKMCTPRPPRRSRSPKEIEQMPQQRGSAQGEIKSSGLPRVNLPKPSSETRLHAQEGQQEMLWRSACDKLKKSCRPATRLHLGLGRR